MRFRTSSRLCHFMLATTAMLSFVGCAATPTNPFQRFFVDQAGAEPAEHTASLASHAAGSAANGKVTRASYVASAGRGQRTSCATGGG